jgi:tetraacyldisaccharide 4'-kinase
MRPTLESCLTRSWLHRGTLAWLLLPAALVYRLLSIAHRGWYAWGLGRVERAPVPLVVVGNVVAGGVGKTPVVIALLEHFQRRGLQVGVVSRGHGRSHDQAHLVTPSDSAQDVGDEPLLLSQRCGVPVAVARQRMDAVRALMQAHPHLQLIVSDDGLQHHAMWHDLALCVFDDRGVGNGWPLPAGPLREAWPRTPRPGSAQWVLHTGANALPDQDRHLPTFRVERQLTGVARNGLGHSRPLTDWVGHPVHALAGIAHPERFFAMLEQQGLQLLTRQALSDHASLSELSNALHQIPAGDALLCTEKDAVKLWQQHPDVWAIALQATLPDALLNRIDEWVQPPLSLPHGQQTA